MVEMHEGLRSGQLRHGHAAGEGQAVPRGGAQRQVVGPEAQRQGAVGQGAHGAGRARLAALPAQDAARLGRGEEVHRRIREDPRRRRVRRAAIDQGRGVELRHAPLPQGRAAPAQEQRLLRLGRGVDEDGARFREDLGDLGAQLLAQLVVQVGQRLVQEHQPRLLHQGAGEGAALLLTARQLQRAALQHALQAHQPGGGPHPAVDLVPRHAHQAQGRGDVLEDRQAGVVDELLVDHRHAAVLHAPAGHVLAAPQDAPGGRLVQPRHEPHERGLARQRRPQEDVHRPRLQHEIRGVDMRVRADALGDPVQRQRHRRPPVHPAVPPAPRVTGGRLQRPSPGARCQRSRARAPRRRDA